MEQKYSLSLIALLKGIVYNHQKEVWENLLHYESDVKKYFIPIGLELFLDKSEGYAFLRQKELEEDELQLPKLAEKRQEKITTTINRVLEIGFLRKLEDLEKNYEIQRIIKGFVNADVIDDTLKRFQGYATEKQETE